jgi:hypothetical protein
MPVVFSVAGKVGAGMGGSDGRCRAGSWVGVWLGKWEGNRCMSIVHYEGDLMLAFFIVLAKFLVTC